MRILLVRLRLIGDVVLTTPLLRAITRRYPGARLAYLVEPAAVPVVRGNPNLAQIVVAPKRRGLARVRDDISIARRLRREHFDVAIDLHGGPRAAWFTWASGAPMRIGYAIAGRAWMYTHVIGRTPDEAPRASVANQWDLLAPLDPSRLIILTSGPSDASAAKAIADGARATLGPLAAAVPDTGEFDLAELRALVGRAAVYIGGDSGPLHIAGTTTTPIVALLGPTLPERSMPWRDARWFAEAVDAGPLECRPCRQRECAPGDFRCLTRITADQVAAAAERALARGPGQSGADPSGPRGEPERLAPHREMASS